MSIKISIFHEFLHIYYQQTSLQQFFKKNISKNRFIDFTSLFQSGGQFQVYFPPFSLLLPLYWSVSVSVTTSGSTEQIYWKETIADWRNDIYVTNFQLSFYKLSVMIRIQLSDDCEYWSILYFTYNFLFSSIQKLQF